MTAKRLTGAVFLVLGTLIAALAILGASSKVLGLTAVIGGGVAALIAIVSKGRES